MELEDTVRAELATLGIDEARFVDASARTIVPNRHEAETRPGRPDRAPPRSERVEVGAVLGEGGMGVVFHAVQRSLERPVAVKTLRADRDSERQRAELLREARITSAIEHPNVVPVHDLEATGDGRPLVILKHVEGVPWSELIHDDARVREMLEVDDLFEWNLDVVAQLANALRYAHERGFLHRDLKPANVLIGRFGEVYLADWGIAVGLDDDGSGRYPLAKDAVGLAGTPAYMPPEMLGGRADELGPATDVYLLGAILYEIVQGRPPHLAGSFGDILKSIRRSRPELDESVDAELGELIRTAMQKEPADRFPDVTELARALARYRSHRSSAALSAAAELRSAELLAALDAADPEEHDSDDAYRLLGEARFGFRQALTTWPENEAAKAGLGRILEAMIERELDNQNPSAAATLLKEHPAAPDQLVRRISEAAERESTRQQELERIEAEYDPLAGHTTRAAMLIAIAVFFSSVPTIAGVMIDLGVFPDTTLSAIIATACMIVASAVLVFLGQRRGRFSAVSWRIVSGLFVALFAQLTLFGGDWLLGSEVKITVVRLMLIDGVIMAIFAIQYTPRLLFAAAGFFVAYGIGLMEPDWRLYLLSAACFGMSLNLIYVRKWAIDTFGVGTLGPP